MCQASKGVLGCHLWEGEIYILEYEMSLSLFDLTFFFHVHDTGLSGSWPVLELT